MSGCLTVKTFSEQCLVELFAQNAMLALFKDTVDGMSNLIVFKKALHYLNCVLRSTFEETKLESVLGRAGS